MNLLENLPTQTNIAVIFGTLFVLSVFVNIYQYKVNQDEVKKRFEDWQTSLTTANTLAAVNQKTQDSAAIQQQGVDFKLQGVDTKLQRIMDKLNLT